MAETLICEDSCVPTENGDDNMNGGLEFLDVEVLQNASSALHPPQIEYIVRQFLNTRGLLSSLSDTISDFQDEELQTHLKELRICDDRPEEAKIHAKLQDIPFSSFHTKCHVYKLNSDGPGDEDLEEEISAASHWVLPSSDFHGLWESLIYDSNIKNQLINFVMTTIMFSDHHVDSNVISWNRVVLLHGPPGTGKTSLCKALAQKLSIRLSHRYTHGQLIEINSHSLFSKWFSESGKLVMKMFQKIQELIDDPQALVFVLIDEVESLAHARNASLGGTEPSDAIRVVNALLTQIDQIRRYPNVIILTTSNMTEAIDVAFVDRADIKYYIGPPSAQAIYQILCACLRELQQKGIVYPEHPLLVWNKLESSCNHEILAPSLHLQEIARSCQGLSGRTLKKLPFLAHALFLQTPKCSIESFLGALERAAAQQFKEREDLRVEPTYAPNKNTNEK